MNKHNRKLRRELVLLHTILRTALQNCWGEKQEFQSLEFCICIQSKVFFLNRKLRQ